MALTWSIKDIEDQDMCWVEKDVDGKKSEYLNPLTETLIFMTMTVGIGEITNDNWPEFYARVKLFEKLDGPFLYKDGSDWFIEPEDVKNHIGLSTNATFKDKTRNQWFKDNVQITMDSLVRSAKKRVE